MSNPNVLLTSAGRRAYVIDYFKECEGIGNVYASNSNYTIALKRADGYFISPLIYSEDYIPSIISFCKEKNVSVVLSLFDIDLLVLAKHEQDFADAGITLVLAPEVFVEICNDKWKTHQFIKSLGFHSPKTYLHIEDVKNAIELGEISYPILMKPRWGMGSMSIYKVEDEQELEVFTKRCKREIFGSYLKYESSMTADEAILYQELLQGEEYGLDVLNNLQGGYIATFAKQKVAMRSGETDLGRTADPSPFESLAKTISQNSKHKGILSVDLFKTEKGLFVIEMNCRISGHYPLSYLAGFNFPQLLVDWMNGKETNRALLRFDTDLFIVKDLLPTILYKNNEPS